MKFKNCYDYITPYWTRSGNIYTGLTSEDSTRLGKVLGINLFPASDYWKSFFVRIGSEDVYLQTEDPLDEIKYIFLKNHKRVKNSLFERKATADYLLVNEDEEAKRENLFNKAKIDAVFEFKKMSLTDMRKCLRLFGQNADSVSGELVENTLFKLVEANPTMYLEKWVNNKDRETEVLLEQAISRNIIRRNKNVYKFGSEVIGYSMQDTIDFFNNPKNQDIKRAILTSIEAKDFIPTEGVSQHVEEADSVREEGSKLIKEVKAKPKKPTLVSGAPGSDDQAIDISKMEFSE